jgi:hypothetical protein
MGVYRTFSVICPNCDWRYEANLVNAVNATRFPKIKQKVLDRELNRSRCPSCAYIAYVEKPFFYTDVKSNLNVTVYPRKERHFYRRASRETTELFSPFDRTKIAAIKARRVVFGLEELREKIVAHDAGISDEVLEFFKLYLLKEHPFLLDRTKMRVTLNCVDQEKLEFNCTFDQDRNYFTSYVPRTFYEVVAKTLAENESVRPGRGKRPKRATGPFRAEPGASWVNLWRLNPGNDALSALSAYAEAIRADEAIDVDDAAFTKMMKTLPPGKELPAWAKRDLQTIVDHAQDIDRPEIAQRVFEIRFGFDIEDDWFKNSDEEDVKTIWTLLKNLPDIAVEGNTWIRAIYLDEKEDGGGLYDPSTKEIHIGSGLQSGTSVFRNVILHEVGHSVQEKFDSERSDVVAKWLTKEFGWEVIAPTMAGIDRWVASLGGYPAGTSNKIKNEVRSYIQQSIGAGGTFDKATIVNGPTGHLWNDREFLPRQVFQRTKRNWWERCDEYVEHDGKCFFVNYYYAALMKLDEATRDLIVKSMPDPYAAMSHFEFFAELFAWFYDGKAPKRKAIPPTAAAWMINRIGALDLSAPFGPRRPGSPRARGRGRAKAPPKRRPRR